MELVYSPAAIKQLKAMPKAEVARIRIAMEEIAATHPQRMSYVTELVGRRNHWRARKGDYRAVFIIEAECITVVEIGHRKEIYQ